MRIFAWAVLSVAIIWLGVLLDFTYWGMIPIVLVFFGGMIIGAENAKQHMRESLYAILQVEVDKHDEN